MKIVCIGGGHGLSQVLKALKCSGHQLTAIITTTDNGGSTGRLRNKTNQVAYGDIRRCISALAVQPNLLSDITELRFDCSNDLKDHCLGNIILTAFDQQYDSPTQAIAQYCHLMGVKHPVYPMSDQATDLVAQDQNGELLFGEVAIEQLTSLPQKLFLSKSVKAPTQALNAITQADLILIGPGSLITSVMPPLLQDDIRHALQVTKACRVFIENLVTENGVMANLELPLQSSWACQMLGYRFFDMSLSRGALGILTNHDLKSLDPQAPHLHDTESLRQLVAGLTRSQLGLSEAEFSFQFASGL